MVETSQERFGCREIKHRQTIEFEVDKTVNPEAVAKFYFTLTEPMMVDVQTWPLNEESDPDLYIAGPGKFDSEKESAEKVGQMNCTWKSDNIGADHVRILPNDPRLLAGTYWICIKPFCDGVNSLAISLKLTEAKTI